MSDVGLPLVYVEGEWICAAADAADVAARVRCSPPLGWSWWALGEVGLAPTYEAAKAAAETAVRKELGL